MFSGNRINATRQFILTAGDANRRAYCFPGVILQLTLFRISILFLLFFCTSFTRRSRDDLLHFLFRCDQSVRVELRRNIQLLALQLQRLVSIQMKITDAYSDLYRL